jgi:two-component system, sensor histidine kinase and response regulator
MLAPALAPTDMPTDVQKPVVLPVVLYVDDEKSNLAVFKSAFRRHYTILTASSASEAHAVVTSNHVDVIISDQRMPHVTGVEFLTQMRSTVPHAVRMVLSGYSDADAILAAVNEAGIYRFIQKPWDELVVKQIIDDAVELTRLRGSQQELIASLQAQNHTFERTLEVRTAELRSANEQLIVSNNEIQRQLFTLREQASELNKYNLQLHNFNLTLEEHNHEKDEILSIVAHDLRNPVTVVIGMAQLLIADGETLAPEQAFDLTKHILNSGEKMAAIIERFLNAKMIESGTMLVSRSAVCVADSVRESIDAYTHHAAEKGITLHFAPSEEMNALTLQTDIVLLQQVLDNVLSNAVKYSPLDKNVWIEMRRGQHRPTALTDDYLFVSNECVHIAIRDEGPGFSAADKPRLFSKFGRLSAKPTNGEQSIGLGLAIVRRLCNALGGSIVAFNNDEEHEYNRYSDAPRSSIGAAFVVSLPLEVVVREPAPFVTSEDVRVRAEATVAREH